MTGPTPILAYGLRIAEAEQQARDYDLEGRLRDTMPADCADRINVTANREVFALSDLVCDLPAETLTDALVQLSSASSIMECMTASPLGPAEKELKPDCDRVLRVLASAIRVLLEVPGALPAELPRDAFVDWPRLKWNGDLPPVRVGVADPA